MHTWILLVWPSGCSKAIPLTILIVILVVSGAIGTRFGLTNTGMGIGAVMLLVRGQP